MAKYDQAGDRVFDESVADITVWVTAGLQETSDMLGVGDIRELALEIQTRVQNRIEWERKKLDKVHTLIVSPDFKIAGGLVKVSSLEEALNG